MKSFLAALVALSALVFQVLADESLQETRKAFTERQTQLSGAYQDGMDKLGAQFLTALGKLREATIKTGDLDGVQAIDAEMSRWKLEGDLPTEASANAEIAKLHSTFRTAKADQVLKRQRGLVAWHEEYDKRLQAMEKSLVTATKVDAAAEVRAERDSLRGSLTIKEAMEAVKAADEAGKSAKPVAGDKTPWKNLKDFKPSKIKGSEYFESGARSWKNPVTVGGTEYQPDDFIYTHASGRLEYEFTRPITAFRATLCLADRSNKGNVIFKIETEAGEIYKSRPLVKGDNRDNVELPLKPTRKLVIVVDENGWDGEDHALVLKPEYK